MQEIKTGLKKPSRTKFVFLVVVLVLAAIAVLVWYLFLNSKDLKPASEETNRQQQNLPQENPPLLEGQTIIQDGQWPEGINEGMILEDKAEILGSYEYIDEEKQAKQSTLRYATDLPKSTIKQHYLRYFSSNGWGLIAGTGFEEGGLSGFASFKEGRGTMDISISFNETQAKTIVDLTLTGYIYD